MRKSGVERPGCVLEIFVPTSGGVHHSWLTPAGHWNGWVEMGSGNNGLNL